MAPSERKPGARAGVKGEVWGASVGSGGTEWNPGERNPQRVGDERIGALKSLVREFGLDANRKSSVDYSRCCIQPCQKRWGKRQGLESGRPGTRFWLCHLQCDRGSQFSQLKVIYHARLW